MNSRTRSEDSSVPLDTTLDGNFKPGLFESILKKVQNREYESKYPYNQMPFKLFRKLGTWSKIWIELLSILSGFVPLYYTLLQEVNNEIPFEIFGCYSYQDLDLYESYKCNYHSFSLTVPSSYLESSQAFLYYFLCGLGIAITLELNCLGSD